MEIIIGSIGVGILVLAFALNLCGRIAFDSKEYAGLNFVGASVACYASYLIGYFPFVILEGIWAAVALTRIASFYPIVNMLRIR